MFSKLKIATRIGLGFGTVLLMTLGMGVFAMLQMAKVNDASTEITTNWLPSIKVLKEIDTKTSDYRVTELAHVIAETPAEMQTVENESFFRVEASAAVTRARRGAPTLRALARPADRRKKPAGRIAPPQAAALGDELDEAQFAKY